MATKTIADRINAVEAVIADVMNEIEDAVANRAESWTNVAAMATRAIAAEAGSVTSVDTLHSILNATALAVRADGVCEAHVDYNAAADEWDDEATDASDVRWLIRRLDRLATATQPRSLSPLDAARTRLGCSSWADAYNATLRDIRNRIEDAAAV